MVFVFSDADPLPICMAAEMVSSCKLLDDRCASVALHLPLSFSYICGGQPCPKGMRVHAGMVKAARPCCLAALRCEAARSPACCTCNVFAGASQPSAMAMQLHGMCALASASSNHATPSGEAPDSIQDGAKDRSFSLRTLLAPLLRAACCCADHRLSR